MSKTSEYWVSRERPDERDERSPGLLIGEMLNALLVGLQEAWPEAPAFDDTDEAIAWAKHTESERQRWERRCKVLEARLAEIRGIVG